MATQKHLKRKEDEHRLMLENGIKSLLASQAKVVEAVDGLMKQLTILSEQSHLMAQAQKEKPSVKAKPIRK